MSFDTYAQWVASDAYSRASARPQLSYFGAKGDGVTNDRAAVLAAVAAVGSNAPLYAAPGAYYLSADTALGAMTVLEFGAGFSGPGRAQIGRAVLDGDRDDARNPYPGHSNYLVSPAYTYHAFDQQGIAEGIRKNTKIIQRFYDGTALSTAQVTGNALDIKVEYGYRSTGANPATGTTCLVGGVIEVTHGAAITGAPVGTAGTTATRPIFVVASGGVNMGGADGSVTSSVAKDGTFIVDSRVKWWDADDNGATGAFKVADITTQVVTSRRSGGYNYYGATGPDGAAINNPALAFCRRLAEMHNRDVYLVLGAGGYYDSISTWVVDPFVSYVANKTDIELALTAAGCTQVDYYLWMPHENNASGGTYATDLQTLITKLKAETWWSASESYFICGQVCPEWTDANRTSFVAAINSLSSDGDAHTLVADSLSLTSTGVSGDNGRFFSGESLHLLGYFNFYNAIAGHWPTEFTPWASSTVPLYSGYDGQLRECNFYYDFCMNGPRATHAANREGWLGVITAVPVKYAPGNTVEGYYKGSACFSAYTAPGTGGFDYQDKTGWVSYPLRDGLFIGGWSGVVGAHTNGDVSGSTPGWENAIRIGGSGGSVWSGAGVVSKVTNGIMLSDYVERGIYVSAKHTHAGSSAVALEVAANAGWTVLRDQFYLFNLPTSAGTAGRVYKDASGFLKVSP